MNMSVLLQWTRQCKVPAQFNVGSLFLLQEVMLRWLNREAMAQLPAQRLTSSLFKSCFERHLENLKGLMRLQEVMLRRLGREVMTQLRCNHAQSGF